MIALLRTVTGFDSTNVAHEDFLPLNSGVNQALVLEYAGMSHELNAFEGGDWQDWNIAGTLYVAQTTDAASDALDVARDAIVAKLRAYPKLNNTTGVFYAHVKGGQPKKEPRVLGGTTFLQEDLMFSIREDVLGATAE